MSHFSIDPVGLKQSLEHVRERFVTKDVSEQSALRGAHGALAAHSHWHAFVGKALRYHAIALGIEYVDAGASRGARWQKTTAGNASRTPLAPARLAAPVAPAAVVGAIGRVEVGPQYAGDSAFTARMRFHQSHYRAAVLGAPFGHGPNAGDANRYGNMLNTASAQAGLNYLSPLIFAKVKGRLAAGGGVLEPYRLLHNMLSSQPMCFNLFGPLVDAPERATRLLGALVGDELARVTRVAIEWAPAPAHEYLDDRTAFDAFVEYERRDGARVALGIETKLTDSFSQKPYDGEKYRRWMRGAGSPFRDEAHGEVAGARYNQLWRNHLLAIAARDHGRTPYGAARSVVVHHGLDRHGAQVVADYRGLLRPNDTTFGAWTLDQVVAAFERVAVGAEEGAWLAAFRARYLDLSTSEPDWNRRHI
ncbi:MAG: hypothetical protein JWM10_3515 [Myxococcaceae bacterium]|nr:hypothetical protein [Myxococcaceae bacterium]